MKLEYCTYTNKCTDSKHILATLCVNRVFCVSISFICLFVSKILEVL